jgi:hypothetical protein
MLVDLLELWLLSILRTRMRLRQVLRSIFQALLRLSDCLIGLHPLFFGLLYMFFCPCYLLRYLDGMLPGTVDLPEQPFAVPPFVCLAIKSAS